MQTTDNNIYSFLSLVQSGLWEKEARLSPFGKVDFEEIMHLAEEQSVVGLVTAGLEYVVDAKVPQEWVLQFVGSSLQLEQRNTAMNKFIAEMIDNMRVAGIYTLLVKGQGIAQCYEKPLWRASGDVDLLLSNDNYEKAKAFLQPLSSSQKKEEHYSKHLGLSIGEWYVEIHGSLRSGLSENVDREIDKVQRNVFYGGSVRSWNNGNTQVFLPAPDEDVFFVFTHFIKHFYKEGLGLRQVCDWIRLLWKYRESLNHGILESRIKSAGLMSEWKGFAAVAVDYLGMPAAAMPFYNANHNHKKAEKIVKLILGGYTGNKYKDTLRIAMIYPWNTLKFLPGILWHVNWLKIKERLLPQMKR